MGPKFALRDVLHGRRRKQRSMRLPTREPQKEQSLTPPALSILAPSPPNLLIKAYRNFRISTPLRRGPFNVGLPCLSSKIHPYAPQSPWRLRIKPRTDAHAGDGEPNTGKLETRTYAVYVSATCGITGVPTASCGEVGMCYFARDGGLGRLKKRKM